MKIIFFGLGSIGKRHAKLLLENYSHELYAFRSGKSGSINDLGIKEINDWKQFTELKPDIAFITNPTSEHISTAIKCAEAGCNLFIEKPIDSSSENLDKLLEIVEKNKLVTYVSYNLRFHPVINKLKELIDTGSFLHMKVFCTSYLPDWRPNQDYKKNYSAIASLGGGVLLDLSHEIDYTNFLLGNIKITGGEYSRRADITVDSEDTADMMVDSDKGPAIIHINFMSHIKQRIIQLDLDNRAFVGDLFNCKIEEHKNGKITETFTFEYDPNFTYRKQLEYFFSNYENPAMMNNLADSAGLFKKIVEFKSLNSYRRNK
jgi:predicted dehydrogenase